ncbi:d-isomer specific 2-hydroxyacid dehydrogenase NAD-binding protein [Chrysochromulina tobinii]|uniref:D-isomer specific 2-hydroxyacid dehydrogenase NAD-binding protein n=1 Tax=Chrysochromulina tobinii TaxID=1460289 RepID=A0A0M0JI37_9EUKA|nr:d-isomer specific 2-hydroxyacid dehydrogenase NAD-binding protein [Chrysochromulina tobinii]|eukprot:KOO25972.1 d-isomer specific 2-hydroxyacid dehydrogenase NAD-binding protein [Chrysochromulina sp. CCMP291]
MLRSAVGVALATGVTVAVFTYRQRRALTSAAKRALRAHYCRDVDDELLHVLRTSATEAVSVTAGGDLPDDVDVLIFPGAATPDRVYAAAAALPNLKALIMAYAGILPAQIDKMRVAFGDRLGSTVTLHNLHHNAPMTAEMGVALLLAATKRLLPADAKLRAGDWRPRGLPFPGEEVDPPMPMVLLEGRTALVLGLGHLGTRVAKVLHALGMRVLGTRRSVRPGSMTVVDGVEVYSAEELASLLPRADVLMICLPSTALTRSLLGAKELALLPLGSVLVNVGRGDIVDESALFEALRSGRLFGAGIDVWYNYPANFAAASSTPPSTLPFHELDSVVLSPHRGGGIGIRDTELVRMRHLGQMIAEAASGKPMPNKWDFAQGY